MCGRSLDAKANPKSKLWDDEEWRRCVRACMRACVCACACKRHIAGAAVRSTGCIDARAVLREATADDANQVNVNDVKQARVSDVT